MVAFELTAADHELVEMARQAQTYAHAPHSEYRVGAALRARNGRVFKGCNVEHIVMSESCCAEKVVLYKAISEGEHEFDAIAIWTDSSPPAAPCGSCRQLLHSWKIDKVILANAQGELLTCFPSALLPLPFELDTK